jgi:hypothetical protein
MSWETMNHLATWACAASATMCASVLIIHIRLQRRVLADTMSAMSTLYDTYREGWDYLGEELQALRARVAELEAK